MKKRHFGTFASFAMIAIGLMATSTGAAACEAPSIVKSIDPPGFYDDPAGYSQAVKPMRAFIARLNRASDERDYACVLDLLGTWAQADALMGPITHSYQGYYERSWAGTDFAFVLMRIPANLRIANTDRMVTIDAWLRRIAVATRDAEDINRLHNNLVYWAGLNLISIGIVANQPQLIDSGLARVREGIRDIREDGSLAREVKRGNRALHYHTFALIPLVFAAELIHPRGVDLYQENAHAIGRLADLVIEAVRDPATFSRITPIKQDLFPWTFQDELAWMEPYYARTHDARLPSLIAPRRPFSEWRLGGNVTEAWGVPLPRQ